MVTAALELAYSPMHDMVNTRLLEALSACSNVVVVAGDRHYAPVYGDRIRWAHAHEFRTDTASPVRNRLAMGLNLAAQRAVLGKLRPDLVFFLGHDVLVFGLGSLLCSGLNVCVVHHVHVDELRHPVKRASFGLYKNRVSHVVFADHIREYLVDVVGVSADRVHVVPHPAYDYHTSDHRVDDESGVRTYVGFSSSNDDQWISELVAADTRSGILERHRCRLVLKSRALEHQSTSLRVFSGLMVRSEYDRAFATAAGVVIPLGSHFEHRISGVMIDALSYGKPVIGTNVVSLRHYSHRYPGIVTVCDTATGLLDAIANQPTVFGHEAFARFRLDHSVARVSAGLLPLFAGRASSRHTARPE